MTEYQQGVDSMARSCLDALQVFKDGYWSVLDIEQWLHAIIQNDTTYLEKIKDELQHRHQS